MNWISNKAGTGRHLLKIAVALLVVVSTALLTVTVSRRPEMTPTHVSLRQRSSRHASSVPPLALPPKALPIQPFPSILAAQITTLEAHNRFFYHGNVHRPEVALTFDDGPSPVYTPQVLGILQKYKIKATFFDIGSMVEAYPELAKAELKAGHIVGNHTLTHADLPMLSPEAIKAQIQQSSDEIKRATGVRPTFIRPPYGDVDASTLKEINILALTIVLWNNEAQDWASPGTSVIVARILDMARNGAIILLHDGGGTRSQTVEALPGIIEQLHGHGYAFVKMDELVAHMQEQKSVASLPSAHR
ncbi:MAG TPA: polysaccharide deacetylase family protein [Ktedonobacteraceae bacterium]|jgi:peptidoglycan/xylan/chitin deacetylase (PgdA/CDA1 family)